MPNESVTECHGLRHHIYTMSPSCMILYASIYGRVTRGSTPPKRRDLTYDISRLNNPCREVFEGSTIVVPLSSNHISLSQNMIPSGRFPGVGMYMCAGNGPY